MEIKAKKDIEINRKNLNIVISARLRNQNLINQAINIQDKLSKKSGFWSGEEEIRKWRQMH